MKKQYLVLVQHNHQVKENKWYNVRACVDSPRNRTYETYAEARSALDEYLRTYNKEFSYNSKGERTETTTCGMIGIDTVYTKDDDKRNRVVNWMIKEREVSDWEVVADSN